MQKEKENWFQKTVVGLESALLGYVYRIIFRREPSEEVVQDSFLKLWNQEYPKFDEHYPKAWLYRVARNLAIDYIRREKRIDLEESLEEVLSTPCISQELFDASQIFQEMKKLPKSEQEVLFLKFSEELSYREISEATGLSVSNVGFKIHQGIQKLKDVILAELKINEE